MGVNLGLRIRVSEKPMLAMFGPDTDNVTGQWRIVAFIPQRSNRFLYASYEDMLNLLLYFKFY